MNARLQDRRILVTHADRYMGPAIATLFQDEGAEVLQDVDPLTEPGACDDLITRVGELDVLVANLAHPPRATSVTRIADDEWHALFDHLVHPLMKLVRAVAPAMIQRGSGKIVAITSAAPMRGIPDASAYCAARGAQNAFVRAAGLELAPHNVQFNAVGQNYVRNPTYYPEDLLDTPRFAKHLARNVPSQRVAEGWESAELALFLASDKSDFLVGQVVPFAGGWVT
ncbi:MAG TPA: SDR family oxidoreductase [Polyangiales bacterium]|nr:SDR family oxidoreductase [Polyangiales bacterium]